MTKRRTDTAQERANVLKMVRAAVRLRYSIEADNALNKILPEAEARFDAMVLRGKLPEFIDIKRAIGL